MPRSTRRHGGSKGRRTRKRVSITDNSHAALATRQGAENIARPRKPVPIRRIPASLFKRYEAISPFELKGALIKEAKGEAAANNRTAKATAAMGTVTKLAAGKHPHKMLNAGRGNPNFFNSYCRVLFGRLQIAAVGMSEPLDKDLMVFPRLGKTNYKKAFEGAIRGWPAKDRGFFMNYMAFLAGRARAVGEQPNVILHDLLISTLGCFYPSPPRIQPHLALVAKEFLHRLVLADRGKDDAGLPGLKLKPDDFDAFATEGAAAGILYVFNTLKENFILNPGDHIALITPIFSPYLEMPTMVDPGGYGLKIVKLEGDPNNNFALSKETIDKLRDKRIKALFMVNPGNPGAYSLPKQNIVDIGHIVNTVRQDLLVLSDNVYAPFAPRYYSFMASCPRNTIEVFSLSKYFGTTGWRLGLVMLAKNNRFNKQLAGLSEARKKLLDVRYYTATLTPRKLTFMERLVLDSRQVAEAHVGGLSTPQQTLMGLLLYFDMQDQDRQYSHELRAILKKRITSFYTQLNMDPHILPSATDYYSMVHIPDVAEHLYGRAARDYLVKNYNYLEFLFHLARVYHVVLLPGNGFGANEWRLRISLANLPDAAYVKIGQALRNCVGDFVAGSKAPRIKGF